MGCYRAKFDYHKLLKQSKPQSRMKGNVTSVTPVDHATLPPELKSLEADIADLAVIENGIPLDIILDENDKQPVGIYDKNEQTDLHNGMNIAM